MVPVSLTVIQIANLAVYWVTLIVALVACRIRPVVRGYILPFWLVALHGAVYYTALQWSALTHSLPPWNPWMDYQDWSAALRLHGALTILGMCFLILFEERATQRRMLG